MLMTYFTLNGTQLFTYQLVIAKWKKKKKIFRVLIHFDILHVCVKYIYGICKLLQNTYYREIVRVTGNQSWTEAYDSVSYKWRSWISERESKLPKRTSLATLNQDSFCFTAYLQTRTSFNPRHYSFHSIQFYSNWTWYWTFLLCKTFHSFVKYERNPEVKKRQKKMYEALQDRVITGDLIFFLNFCFSLTEHILFQNISSGVVSIYKNT